MSVNTSFTAIIVPDDENITKKVSEIVGKKMYNVNVVM